MPMMKNAITKYRQSCKYAWVGIAMNVMDESIVAKIDMPATYHGILLPPRK